MEDSNSVVSVGDGLGFVVEGQAARRFIITTVRSLRVLPLYEYHPDYRDWSYRGLVGRRRGPCYVTAECVFVDLVANIAVLASPADRVAFASDEEIQEFEALVASVPALSVARDPEKHAFRPKEGARLPSPDGGWSPCEIIATDCGVLIEPPANIDARILGGPIVNDDGEAIGLVSDDFRGPYPFLAHHLPRWLADEIGASNPSIRR
jgi:hypothetical protein